MPNQVKRWPENVSSMSKHINLCSRRRAKCWPKRNRFPDNPRAQRQRGRLPTQVGAHRPRGNREFRSCRSGPSPSVLSCASYSTSSATAGLEASAAQAEIGPIETDEEVCEKVSLHRHQISSKPNSGNFGASEPSGPTSFDFRSGDIIMTLLSRSDILYTGG